MRRRNKQVKYAYEYGDNALPHLKDLVRKDPDSEKSKILVYLNTHCIIVRPGIVKDILEPNDIIGFGNLYSDGTYLWDDVFSGYVKKYNIPLPEEFRNHLLKNYNKRMNSHNSLQLIDRIDIEGNFVSNKTYILTIYKNGRYIFQNSAGGEEILHGSIAHDDAEYIIDPIMTELYCYDIDFHGVPKADGYCWKLTCYHNSEKIKVIKGWTGEDLWRLKQVSKILKFAYCYITKDIRFEEWIDSLEGIIKSIDD